MFSKIIIFISIFIYCKAVNYSNLYEGDSCYHDGDGIRGVCTRLSSCITAVFYDLPLKEYPPICSFIGLEPVVCCTSCRIIPNATERAVINVDGIFFKSNGAQRSWDKCLEYSQNLPYSCKDSTWRIQKRNETTCMDVYVQPALDVMGTNVKSREEYPHMALLGYGEERESAQWLCAGSVISDRFILTAAHCGAQSALGKVRHVALGILKRSDPRAVWQHFAVEKFIPEPDYSYPSTYHDIALIQTDKQIVFSTTVLPICLAYKAPDGDMGELALVTGWGALGPSKPLADQLQQAMLNKYDESECSKLYPPHQRFRPRGVDHNIQMCYGDRDGNDDTCQGDSGGPLQPITLDNRFCTKFIFGVTSNGRQCGREHNAGIYTKVLPYLDWIEDIVWPRHNNK